MQPFDESELEVVGEKSGSYPYSPTKPRFNTPITPKENLLRVLRHETPCWIPFVSDTQAFSPRILPDAIARRMATDALGALKPEEYNPIGWFGVEWVYDDKVRGATNRPGAAPLDDINDWHDLEFPDVDSYDWEESARINASFKDPERFLTFRMTTGYWERLMSVLEVDEAAISMIDEDCVDAVREFFEALTDLYIKVVDHAWDAYQPELFLWHDDWGTQNAPFFSVQTIDEMVVPHLSRLVKHVHDKGAFFEFHSCGMNEPNVPLMIKAGADMWNGQELNDKRKLAAQYSDQLMFGVMPPAIPEGATDEEIEALAAEFFDYYKDKRIYIDDRAFNMTFTKAIYRLARQYYAG